MGLKERQWIEQGTKEWVPEFEKEIKERSGASVKIEPDWKSFENSMTALEKVKYQGFQFISNAFYQIGRDDTGKKALADIKKVVLKNVDSGDKNKLSVKGGVVTLESAWGADAYMSETDVQSAIEAAL
jgi:hypothetical protein